MKVVFIGQKGIPAIYGGIEKHVQELSTRLADLGYDITVYTRPYYTPAQKQYYQKVKLVSLPTIKSKHLDAISHTLIATIHALFKINPDIYHFHGVGPALLCWLPRIFRPRAKVLTTFHCIDRQHQKWGLMARLMLWLGEFCSGRFSHQVIAVSRTIQSYIYESFKQDSVYIPNGISEMQFYKPSLIKEKFGLKGQDYILVVARLIPHKGIHYLIKAYQQIKPKLKLVIAGDSSYTDDYVRKLKKLAGDDPQIIFTGFQSGQTLAELFSNASLYVHPSESEGLPIAVLEAAAYGLCVLASDIPANLEIVRHCGLSFENKNVADLAAKLDLLLANKQEIEATGRQARKYVLKNYNWQDIVKKTDQTYKKLYGQESFRIGLASRVATS